MPFDEAVQLNPQVVLERGTMYPFVSMQAVSPGRREAEADELRVFKGGGSRFADGDTLMAKITPCLENGKIARFFTRGPERTAHGSTEFLVIRGRSGVTDNQFAYYLTTSEDVRAFAISQMSGTSGRQRVPSDSLHHLQVNVPPLPEQRRIAHILGTLDDKIELNRRMNQTLETMARAIFKSWFIDFDPVCAKAEGREPVGMNPETAALFPDSFQDFLLGKIPKGWEVKPFSEIVEINPPRTLKRGTIAPYVDMASLPTSGSQLEVPPAFREYKSGSRFQNGDVLFARITPCLENGKTALVDFLEEGDIAAGSTEFFVFGPDLAGSYFAYCVSRWSAFRDHAIAAMTGTSGRQRVQKSAFDHFEIAVPSRETLMIFEERMRSLFVQQQSNSMESRSLAGIRDVLLPRLLSGERVGAGEP